jgi:hypothetical protein
MAQVLNSFRDLDTTRIYEHPGQRRVPTTHDSAHPRNCQPAQPYVEQLISIFLHGAPFNPRTTSVQAGRPVLVRSTHHRCADLYEQHGVDLAAEPVIGVGSVCRRQHSPAVEQVMRSLAARGLRLHGFGVKTGGLARYADALVSSDSMAWSLRGRHVPGCSPSHRSESNCLRFALAWHRHVTDSLPGQTAAPPTLRAVA